MSRHDRRPWRVTVAACAATLLALVCAAACDQTRAQLEISLAGRPTVTPFIVHGNCLAGWTLSATFVIRERGDESAVLTFLTYRAEDEITGRVLAGESLDGATLRDRYGEAGIRIDAEGRLELPVSMRVEGVLAQTILSGALQARDSKGAIQQAFRFATQPINSLPPEGVGGACQAG